MLGYRRYPDFIRAIDRFPLMRLKSPVTVVLVASLLTTFGAACSSDSDAPLSRDLVAAEASSVPSGGRTGDDAKTVSWGDLIDIYSFPIESKLRLCRDSQVPDGAQLSGIKHVLGRPELFGLGSDDECSLQIASTINDLTLFHRSNFEGCHVAFEAKGEVVQFVQFAPANSTEVELQKCYIRIGLWATGRGDFAEIPDEELFIPLAETRWWGLPGMPEFVPDIPFDN